MRKRAKLIVFLMEAGPTSDYMTVLNNEYKYSVALPHGAVGWSVVGDCGIYLFILTYF